MKKDISLKLNRFLDSHRPLAEEYYVVYFMVEIRKLIEHDRTAGKYPNLWFFCNWVVHTTIDKEHTFKKGMKPLLKVADLQMTLYHFSLENLLNEIRDAANSYRLTIPFTQHRTEWIVFCENLFSILKDQPLLDKTHTPNIEYCVVEIRNGAVKLEVHRGATRALTEIFHVGQENSWAAVLRSFKLNE